VDAQGYRQRRERTLGEVAARAVDEVRRTGSAVALESMSSAERKIVHTKVQAFPGMSTTSEGAEPNRYVVVAPTVEE
jgi:spoIIIJ-associated protein